MPQPDPTTPIGFVLMLLRGRADRARTADSVGASVVELVVITAGLVLLAAVVFTALNGKITAALGKINF
ncbi:hypothetical protein [Kineosporia sp. A_224]|jgi:hypothetical protein|uniref:hypothetical protein n=1 Tax=Kineosporia sp. A_224 TaxID=1962180 RepID=UPI000B4B2D9E|nr:hypothetical protein [Kineosporia sp. A_224]